MPGLSGPADAHRPAWRAQGRSPDGIAAELRQAARAHDGLDATPGFAADASAWPARRLAGLALVALAALLALALFPLTLALFLLWLLLLRRHERRDAPAEGARRPGQLDRLAAQENRFNQNQITVLSWVKPGWFRALTLRLVLLSANTTARVLLWTKRDFFGLESIHHAQWVLIDGGRRLLFFSNFDGSWESYIGEFVDKAHIALTPIWTNCIGFPETRFLIFGGAANEEHFKQLVRDNQLPTPVWYAAYPELSVPNVNDASDLNRGLHDARRAPAAWLALL